MEPFDDENIPLFTVGRVAEIGSVQVTERMVIERYSHVMHIVSNVTGRLRAGLDAVDALFADPQHPYTIGLLGSIPRLDVDRERLATIEGTVPSPNNQPRGCRFAPRCPFADRRCNAEPPPLRELGAGHLVACWKAPVELARIAA